MLACFVTLAGALNEHHALHRTAIGALNGTTLGRAGQCFQAGLIYHGRETTAEFRQLGHVIGRKAAGLDDGAHGFFGDGTAVLRDLHRKAARCPTCLRKGRSQMHADLRVCHNTRNEFRHARVLWFGIGLAKGHALVQLGGPTTELVFAFDDQHLVASFSRLNGGRQARHAAANDQDAFVRSAVRVTCGHRHFLELGTTHANIVVSHFLSHFVMVGSLSHDPEHAFTQVGARHGHIRKTEGFGLGTARAGADHYMGDAFVRDVVSDGLHAFSTAKKVVALDHLHLAFALGHLFHRSKIEHITQTTAGAKIRGEFIVCHLMLPPWLSGKSP